MAAVPVIYQRLDDTVLARRLSGLPCGWQRAVSAAWIERVLDAVRPWCRRELQELIDRAVASLRGTDDEDPRVLSDQIRRMLPVRSSGPLTLTTSTSAEGVAFSLGDAARCALLLGADPQHLRAVARLGDVFRKLSIRVSMRRRHQEHVHAYIGMPGDFEAEARRLEEDPALSREARGFLAVLDLAEEQEREGADFSAAPQEHFFDRCWDGPPDLARIIGDPPVWVG